MHPSVSVVIPVFREGKLLEEAIRSVLAQSFRDFEIVVVDNNATPETLEIAQSFARCGIVRLLHEPEQGASSARNTGIRNSRGTFIAAFDGDDVMKPERLARQFAAIRDRHDIALVSCHHDVMSHDGKEIRRRNVPELSYGPKDTMEFKSILKRFLAPLNLPHTDSFDLFGGSHMFFRKKTAIAAGLFDERLNLCGKQDWEFSMRMFEKGRLLLLPESLQYFRYATPEMNLHKPKTKHTTKCLLSEEKLLGVLWERYGAPFPENRKAFRQLAAHTLRVFGCHLMRLASGKDTGKILLERAIEQDPSDLGLWKHYLKSWAPSSLHPRLFHFDREQDEKPDFDRTFARNYLRWPPAIPPGPAPGTLVRTAGRGKMPDRNLH